MSRIKPGRNVRLLVEGKDGYALIQLTARHGVDWDGADPRLPFVEDAGGVTKLLEALPTAAKTFARLGVVVDANQSRTSRWEQLRGAVPSLPPAADPAGTVVETPVGRFGVWLMPDNRSDGKLEDFLAALVPPADPVWPYSDEVVTEAKRRGASFMDVDRPKARLATWLAWHSSPGVPYGTAMRAKAFLHDTPLGQDFFAWFERLYLA